MAAEDQSESFAVADDSSRVETPTDNLGELAPSIGHWLSRRVEGAGGSATVCVTVLPGRWLFRVESGSCASTIEHPFRRECSTADVGNLVRRWARTSGFGSRSETAHGHEVRVALTSPAASRS